MLLVHHKTLKVQVINWKLTRIDLPRYMCIIVLLKISSVMGISFNRQKLVLLSFDLKKTNAATMQAD